jgi:ketosteroid isomerase-like protein
MKDVSQLFMLFCLSFAVMGQKPAPESPLQSLVNAERVFARAAEEQGTRSAFMAFIADDGILFRPAAVKGKSWMQANPEPASASRSRLSWRPIFADISSAGDLGYTTGPWEFKTETNDPKPVAWGDYMTIWKMQTDGTWKFVLDLGCRHSEPKTSAPSWEPPASSPRQPFHADKINIVAVRSQLVKIDSEFSGQSSHFGAREAFFTYAAKELRLYRNDLQVLVGKDAALTALPLNNLSLIWKPAFADVAASGDLGYCYGTYELQNESGFATETGNYVHIWKKISGKWQVVVDVANPLPKEKQ